MNNADVVLLSYATVKLQHLRDGLSESDSMFGLCFAPSKWRRRDIRLYLKGRI